LPYEHSASGHTLPELYFDALRAPAPSRSRFGIHTRSLTVAVQTVISQPA